MGKIVMAVSAGVTAFVLALTAGAVYVSRNLTTTVAIAKQPESPSVSAVQMAADALPTPAAVAQAASVSAQDAASVAAKYLNRTDLYSVELADFQGAKAYKVTFSSGDIAYVSLTGQVLSTTPPPPPQVVTVGGGGAGGHHGSGGSSSSGGEHEDNHEGEGEGD